MRDLINFSYNIDATNLRQFGEVFYLAHENYYIYIIPVGDEKNSIFFHLLKLINDSSHFTHLLTTNGAPTIEINNTHFYCIVSTFKLHQTINEWQLNIPALYPKQYPLAAHFKTKWLQKNQVHEQYLNLALDKTPPMMRAVLFDLATYYIHLSEEAYRLLRPFEQAPFSTSLSHVRLKPNTQLYEFFMPSYLTLDNRSRIYCEYIRHLFLETLDLQLVARVVAHIVNNDPLSETEWRFLYARLYFPTHFYDIVYDIVKHSEVNLDAIYEQTMHYSTLLAGLPTIVEQYCGINLETPEWTKMDRQL